MRAAGAPPGDPMALLAANLTAGEGGSSIGYYQAAGIGAMTDNDFVLGGTSYALTQLYAGEFAVVACFGSDAAAPPAAVADTLTLGIGGRDFAFAARASYLSGQGCFEWNRPDRFVLDWGDVALVTVKASGSNAGGAVRLNGSGRVGETLTASTADIVDPDGLTTPGYTYQWLRMEGTAETAISGAAASTFMLVAADLGKMIKVRVRFTDDPGNAETLTSAGVTIRAAMPPATCPRLHHAVRTDPNLDRDRDGGGVDAGWSNVCIWIC